MAFSVSHSIFQGSSVTGRSFKSGQAFDVGRLSDFDIAIANQTLFERAKSFGIRAKTDPNRIGPLKDETLELLGLRELRDALSIQAGRKVEFLLFDNLGSAFRRPSIFVP